MWTVQTRKTRYGWTYWIREGRKLLQSGGGYNSASQAAYAAGSATLAECHARGIQWPPDIKTDWGKDQ